MLIDVLGPVRVRADAGASELTLPSARAAAALAWLTFHANQAVSLPSLTDVLWTDPPDSAIARTRALVRGLQDLLGAATLDVTPAVRLNIAAGSIDVTRFTGLLDDSARLRTAGDHEAARGAIVTALALWRGRPYPELARVEVSSAVARLVGMRLDALEDLAALDLRGEIDYTVVAELRSLVVLHPERMGLRRTLALALYRTDRQVEALDALRVAKADLGDADGGAARLQQAILRHDPALAIGELPTG